jgi:hypothetical protein
LYNFGFWVWVASNVKNCPVSANIAVAMLDSGLLFHSTSQHHQFQLCWLPCIRLPECPTITCSPRRWQLQCLLEQIIFKVWCSSSLKTKVVWCKIVPTLKTYLISVIFLSGTWPYVCHN